VKPEYPPKFVNESWEQNQDSRLLGSIVDYRRNPFRNSLSLLPAGLIVKPRLYLDIDRRILRQFIDFPQKPKIFNGYDSLQSIQSQLSVLKEISMNRLVSSAFFNKYHYPLSIEEPVGAYVSNNRKCSLFVGIEAKHVLDKNHILFGPDDFRIKDYYMDQKSLIEDGIVRLNLNIVLDDFQGVVTISDSGEKSFVVIDSESWYFRSN
jgi:hypothetical protein